ncbi:MAG: helix-turn-helix transcriptional regulator [Deltaproteobacteria bacterium]|nr:helix-turn-helix transcriptional regulator [Deltaproteobacteria bacterium]
MPAKLEQNIGGRVAQFRETAGLTQDNLAEKVGVTIETISRLERGVSIPSIARLDTIANALGVELTDLLSTTEGKSKKAQALDALKRELTRRTTSDIEFIHKLARQVFAHMDSK